MAGWAENLSMRTLVCLAALVSAFTPDLALAQRRISGETYRAWADDANGRPCETQLFGTRRGLGVYPEAAERERLSGNVLLTFDTRYQDGRISIVNPRVFAAEPAGALEAAALALAAEFDFPPEMRNCEGLRAELFFRVNDLNPDRVLRGFVTGSRAVPPLSPEATRATRDGNLSRHCGVANGPVNLAALREASTRLYPDFALTRAYEGFAIVQFTIAQDGAAVDPHVLDELPGEMGFGAAAAEVVRLARFEPRSAPCEDAAMTIRFTLSR